MKKIVFAFIFFIACFQINAQDFAKRLTEAKAAYSSGKLDDSRFAMEQMLQELDVITGKEVLKILPAKMGDKSANAKADNVTGSSGFFGVIIHREYGTVDSSNIDLEIISNSPLISSINAILSVPFMGASGDNKIIKINGYKALVEKVAGPNERTDYEIQLPLNSALITFKAPGYSQDDVIKMANTLPVEDIAKMLQ
ncbi:MAG TPA: hypothetical protein VNT20_21985 [Flavisolibacter sp.]|jgi:hypothetical protein|nr:hypothetical protein [Flavisolibacter sp.]